MQAVLQYEAEPFGIRVIIIEPGIVESHFYYDLKIAIKAQRTNSFPERMQKYNESSTSKLS
jgi:hypothetical protein